MKKIGFTTDTNMLAKVNETLAKSESILDVTEIFTKYMDAQKKNGGNSRLIYYMPEIVIEELAAQKIFDFNEKYEKIKAISDTISYGLSGNLPDNNIEKLIKKDKDAHIEKYKILKLDYTKEMFEEIVSDALKKKPPFDKSKDGRKTDSGFKDALIWKTILYSKEIDECDKFYFFSGDSVFNDNKEELEKNFKKNHEKTEVEIVCYKPDGNQRQNALQKLVADNNLILTEIVKLYDKTAVLQYVKKIDFDPQKNKLINGFNSLKLIDINFCDFDTSDFVIEEVNENKNVFEINISFKTEKYVVTNIDCDNQYDLEGNILLLFDSSIKFIKGEITNLRFKKYTNYLEKYISNINMINDAIKNGIEIANDNNMRIKTLELANNPINEGVKIKTGNLLYNIIDKEINGKNDIYNIGLSKLYGIDNTKKENKIDE